MNKSAILVATIGALGLASACGGATAGDHTTSASHTEQTVYSGSSDNMIVGSGRMVSRDDTVGRFARLDLAGPIDVVIRQGNARSLSISAEDNIIDLVDYRIEGDVLRLGTREGSSFRTREGIRAVLTVPDLDAVHLSASGDVRFDGWDADAVELDIGGSGNIELGGEIRRVTARIGGSGDIDLAPALMRQVDADVDGSGSIRMGSLDRLDADINGSGSIEAGVVGELSAVINGSGEILYRSAERIIRQDVNGSGRISIR